MRGSDNSRGLEQKYHLLKERFEDISRDYVELDKANKHMAI